MELDAQDLAVIEQALKEGINNGVSYQTALNYRGVLNKLQQTPHQGGSLQDGQTRVMQDGFRYDYDDSAT
ncbi:hypothetical protein DUZ99_04470 [Xylanibacillus composti]|uniref:Uncharacterized protein n=1 Tax=Xylanibacillus composti TaxID=1572762 RepID=A0A8J4M177_9BACL|nr:hypothetical protein [Xylanibacillus composti]MDT9724243.1 hypothetical protein [Xylanibacillus composti]GIQ68239.1 hypothetical protein XYCOK13_10630 [Xylanibacillus composti]